MAFDAGAVVGHLKLNTKQWETGLKKSQSGLRSWAGRITTFLTSPLGAFATLTATMVGATWALKKFLNAAGEQQKQELLLANALKITNNEMLTSIDYLKEQASSIQKVTTVGDELSLSLMRFGLSMGVSGKYIQDATKYAIGLSKAFNIDLQSAMKYVSLAIEGDTTMLRRYIPELRTATSKAEEMAILNRVLTESWKLATAEADTYTGKVQQLRNAWGDILEQLGFKVLPIFEKLTDVIKNVFLPIVSQAVDSLGDLGSEGIIGGILSGLKFVSKGFLTMGKTIETVLNRILYVLGIVFFKPTWSKMAVENLKKIETRYENWFEKINQISVEGLNKIAEANRQLAETIAPTPFTVIAEESRKAKDKITENTNKIIDDINRILPTKKTIAPPEQETVRARFSETASGLGRVGLTPEQAGLVNSFTINISTLSPEAISDFQWEKIARKVNEKLSSARGGR